MYNKIFTKILDSSIWLETHPTRIVWMTLIATMDETGFCQFSALGNLAARAHVTKDEAQEAVRVLEAPDKESGDPDHEGRRIERVPGGWIVLNAEKYRAIVNRAVNQEKTRVRVARYRDKKRGVTEGNDAVTPSETHSEAGASEKSKENPLPPSGGSPKGEPSSLRSEGVGDSVVSEILKMFPKRSRDLTGASRAVIEALKVVSPRNLARCTLYYRRVTETWPTGEARYIPMPEKWFENSCYMDNPETWIKCEEGGGEDHDWMKMQAEVDAELDTFPQFKRKE